MLKNALKYGMTKNEFWYGEDYRDYFLYEEAYYEKMHEQSHIQGRYFYTALSSIASSICGGETIEYPEVDLYKQYKDSINSNNILKKFNKPLNSMTKEERLEYRTEKLKTLY